jgi:hypothetical protein
MNGFICPIQVQSSWNSAKDSPGTTSILLHKSEKCASDSKQKHRNNAQEKQKLQEAIKDYLENFHNLRAHARTIEFTKSDFLEKTLPGFSVYCIFGWLRMDFISVCKSYVQA